MYFNPIMFWQYCFRMYEARSMKCSGSTEETQSPSRILLHFFTLFMTRLKMLKLSG